MNSLFGPCFVMALAFRIFFAVLFLRAVFSLDFGGGTLYLWLLVAGFQSLEKASLEQYNKWNEGKEEYVLQRQSYR